MTDALDVKLAAFGGAGTGRGGRGGGESGFGGRSRGAAPGAMASFIALNDAFNTIVSMMEVGLDMPPTKAQIDSWEGDCNNYNTTVTAWKTMETVDLTRAQRAAHAEPSAAADVDTDQAHAQ